MTESDYFSNMIARLLDKKRYHEQKVLEFEEAIQAQRRTQSLLNDSYTFEAPEPVQKGSVTDAVKGWVATKPAGAEIRVKDILDDIPVRTPNTIRSALLSMVKQGQLTYTPGAGFHKKERETTGMKNMDQLVYSSELPKGGQRE